MAAGSVLDLMEKGEEARKYFTKATDVADTPEGKCISQESDGHVIRLRGELQQDNRVRAAGFRPLRQPEELLSAGEIADGDPFNFNFLRCGPS